MPELEAAASSDAQPIEKTNLPAVSEAPKWIRDATALVALLGTLAGICLSIWGLVEKSRADREAAKTNLEIATAQLKAHNEEYHFEGEQHLRDQQQQAVQKERDDRAQEEERLAKAINDLFQPSGSTEGQIAVLASYVKEDHRYDELIGNALLAKLESTRTSSETALAFGVMEKFDLEWRMQLLIRANETAKIQFKKSVGELFWLKMDSLSAAVPTSKFSSIPRKGGPLAPVQDQFHHVLLDLASAAMPATVTTVAQSQGQFVDARYSQAVINPDVYIQLRLDVLAGLDLFDTNGNQDLYSFWWTKIQDKIKSRHSRTESDLKESVRFSWDVVARSSQMLSATLLKLNGKQSVAKSNGGVHLTDCLLEGSVWPAGRYPEIDFGSSVIGVENLSQVTFSSKTWLSLFDAPSMVLKRELTDSVSKDGDPRWEIEYHDKSPQQRLAVKKDMEAQGFLPANLNSALGPKGLFQ